MNILSINPLTHVLENTLYRQSPNCDDRPENTEINLLVIHNISLPPKEFGSSDVDALFMNQLDFNSHAFYSSLENLRVSAHLFVRRDGEIVQYVPFNKRAWHAGKSFFLGRENCNDFSIGIEMEGSDDIPYTSAQYEKLISLTKLLMKNYPITHQGIVGHSDIAPDRKTDPGKVFDWDYFLSSLED